MTRDIQVEERPVHISCPPDAEPRIYWPEKILLTEVWVTFLADCAKGAGLTLLTQCLCAQRSDPDYSVFMEPDLVQQLFDAKVRAFCSLLSLNAQLPTTSHNLTACPTMSLFRPGTAPIRMKP